MCIQSDLRYALHTDNTSVSLDANVLIEIKRASTIICSMQHHDARREKIKLLIESSDAC